MFFGNIDILIETNPLFLFIITYNIYNILHKIKIFSLKDFLVGVSKFLKPKSFIAYQIAFSYTL